jgi:hypothetical protein
MSDKTLIEWNANVGTRILTIHPDGSFEINENTPPLYALGELAKAFMRLQDRIKRLEEAGDEMWKWRDVISAQKWEKAKEAKP